MPKIEKRNQPALAAANQLLKWRNIENNGGNMKSVKAEIFNENESVARKHNAAHQWHNNQSVIYQK
jgi:hypothetical protein